MADITFANLTNDSSTTDATSFLTASVTPSANKLVLITVIARHGTAVTEPTISGNGLTWVLVNSSGAGGGRAIFDFRAMGATPSAGQITIDFGATTITSCIWIVDEATNMDTSGTNGSGAIVQSVTNSAAGATSLTITLAAFSDANNATFGATTHGQNEATAAGTDFTLLASKGVATPGEGAGTEFKSANDTSVDMSWVTSSACRGIAIEIKNATQTPASAFVGGFISTNTKFWGY